MLRLGRYIGSRGPGLFWIIPFVEGVSTWIDQRTITTSFDAEQTLTSDTVPVNVDAVLFWVVHDAGEGGARGAALRERRQPGGADGACGTSSAARRSQICCADASGSKTNCSSSSTSGRIRGASRFSRWKCAT